MLQVHQQINSRNCGSFQLSSQIEREWETTLRNTFGVGVDEDDDDRSGGGGEEKQGKEEDRENDKDSTAVTATASTPDVDIPIRRRRGSGLSLEGKKADCVLGKVERRVSGKGWLALGGPSNHCVGGRRGSDSLARSSSSSSILSSSSVREDVEGSSKEDKNLRPLSRPQALHLRSYAREARES